MELRLNQKSTPFDLESTLQCGQLFRWKKQGDWWYGTVEGRVLKTKQTASILAFDGVNADFIENYFRLDDNLRLIISEISRDKLVAGAIQSFPGLRIARQPPWECLVSYICATYKNIPAIKDMIFRLSKRFGEKITFENTVFYIFPMPRRLAEASLSELKECGLGYRAKLVRATARVVVEGGVDFEALKEMRYEEARRGLLQLPGVGYKVADCALLFSLEKLEAFPVDVWMKRIIQEHYASFFDSSFIQRFSARKSLSSRDYDKMGAFARDYFGRFAGYAQEYLYHYFRKKPSQVESD